MNDNSNIYDFWGAPKKSTTTPQSAASGCTCASTGQQNCPIHGGSIPEFKTTGEAVGYFYDKQHPNGGMTKMTGPLGDISYYDENLYKPKEPGEPLQNKTLSQAGVFRALNKITNNLPNQFGLLPNVVNTLKTTEDVLSEAKKLSPLTMNDKYKHGVTSCVGAQNGITGSMATATIGTGKEGWDMFKKSTDLFFNPQTSNYGSYGEILDDSMQDMQADFRGIKEGLQHPQDNCYECMKKYYNPKIK